MHKKITILKRRTRCSSRHETRFPHLSHSRSRRLSHRDASERALRGSHWSRYTFSRPRKSAFNWAYRGAGNGRAHGECIDMRHKLHWQSAISSQHRDQEQRREQTHQARTPTGTPRQTTRPDRPFTQSPTALALSSQRRSAFAPSRSVDGTRVGEVLSNPSR